VGPLIIEWKYLSPGLYGYKTNLGTLGLSLAAMYVLVQDLKTALGNSWGDWLNDKKIKFPKAQDPIARWIKQNGAGVLIIVAVVATAGAGAIVIGSAGAISAAGGATAAAAASFSAAAAGSVTVGAGYLVLRGA
jgi:hypothetical protein